MRLSESRVLITDVTTHLVRGGISNWLIVQLDTDTGISGVGDATLEGQTLAVQAVIETLKRDLIIGKSVFDVSHVISTLVSGTFWRGGPVLMSAVGGVEIAMMDAIGKLLEVPVYQLIGGRYRNRIRAYANGWYRTTSQPDRFAEEACVVTARGYTALKLDPLGQTFGEFTPAGLRNAVDIVHRVREAVGEEVDILLDLHGRLTPHAARTYLHAIADVAPYWYEEPLPPEQVDHLPGVMHGYNVRVALGERFYSRSAFRAFFRSGYADVIQPDLGHAGGLFEGRLIAAMAEAEGTMVAPHTGNSPIVTAASLHLAATAPNILIQETFDDFDHPTMRREVFPGLPELANGELPVPTSTGLGVEFDKKAAERYFCQSGRERTSGVLVAQDWPAACWQE
jgi:galactonate dehydratase